MKKLNCRSKKSSTPVLVAGAGASDDVEQHCEKRIRDLELEIEALKRENEELKHKLAGVDIPHHREDYPQKSSAWQEQATSLKSKPDTHSLCSTQKRRSESPAKQFNDEVQKLKVQKVKLQCKIKLDSVGFRLCKASLEKEILQLKKELRKRDFKIRVLLASNRHQHLMLQRKKTQPFAAGKQLQLPLESRKISSNKINGNAAGPAKGNNARIQDTKNELELTMWLHELHSDYERQMKEITEEIKRLKAESLEDENSCSASQDNQVIPIPTDSELKELKEEFSKLSTLVSQMEMTKLQLSESDKCQSNAVEYSDSTGNNNGRSNLKSTPSENSLPSPPGPSQGIMSATQESKAEVCCSCTKRSSCKTPKCKCRAMGSGCRESCGCITSKCTNREADAKSNKAIQSANAVERATCPEGAVRQAQKPPEISHDKEASKRPLRDIGNTMVNSHAGKAGRWKKGQKPVAQK